MSGSQLKERVLIPLAVIVGTVAGLAFLGMQLLGISGASDEVAEASPSATATVAPTDVTPTDSAQPMPSGSETVIGERLPVIVLNGTETAGLAKKVGDNLNFEDWVIQEVGNWTGPAIDQTTVYYPAGAEGIAQELAASQFVKGVIAPADAAFDQSVLTIVLAK